MSKKRMIANVIAYGIGGIGCGLAAGVMFSHAEIFIKALKKKGDN